MSNDDTTVNIDDDTTHIAARGDDVEGHAGRWKGVDAQEPAEDDAQGHAIRAGRVDDEEPADDDVEGHRYRGYVSPTEPPADDEDDVEGHASSWS